jgi:flagellar hook-length control protein FliK
MAPLPFIQAPANTDEELTGMSATRQETKVHTVTPSNRGPSARRIPESASCAVIVKRSEEVQNVEALPTQRDHSTAGKGTPSPLTKDSNTPIAVPAAVVEGNQVAVGGPAVRDDEASPAQQIQRALSALHDELQEASRQVPNTPLVIRTLRLSLMPDNLGPVQILMRLTAGRLEVQVTAETERTASVIRSDSTRLDVLLRQQGVDVADAGIVVVVRETVEPGLKHLGGKADTPLPQPFGQPGHGETQHSGHGSQARQRPASRSAPDVDEGRSHEELEPGISLSPGHRGRIV